ncbi:Wee kinase [Cardiosporidium cionae]|uniref:Wee kinase n=1 Tax=Cardiosporidium cionae TaxID=476202 RepID=A0ABQ7J4P6_9APIC|nr:Wee kinase [Cardiosporidium cionae]|eukprot:KAF8818156.1 Wee kinase [Cardiosporidium cionae]
MACPMCGQGINPMTFSFESKVYFRMLQRLASSFCGTSPATSSSHFEEAESNAATGDSLNVFEEIFPWSRRHSSTSSLPFTSTLEPHLSEHRDAILMNSRLPVLYDVDPSPPSSSHLREDSSLPKGDIVSLPSFPLTNEWPSPHPKMYLPPPRTVAAEDIPNDSLFSTFAATETLSQRKIKNKIIVENQDSMHSKPVRKRLSQNNSTTPSSPMSSVNPFIRRPTVMKNFFFNETEGNSIPTLVNIPTELLITGYYKQFFVESKKLGSGSQGQVYLCTHVLDNLSLGEYAVKKMAVGDNKIWFRKMLREVKIRENIRHGNIIDYKHSWMEMYRSNDLCVWVPWLFVLMEYCNGGTLETLIWKDNEENSSESIVKNFSDCQIWKILLDIIYGLQHLHHSGILHRDIKASNILLKYSVDSFTGKRNITALLSDFGTAEIISDFTQRQNRHGFTGTVEYTAPELLEMDRQGHFRKDYDTKSDMWSLGIVLYALCYGKLPYSHKDPQICRNLILNHSCMILPDFPKRSSLLRHLLLALTSLNPQERPSTDEILTNRSVHRIIFDTHYLEAASEEFTHSF